MKILKQWWSYSILALVVSYAACFPVTYWVNTILKNVDTKWVPYWYLLIGYLLLAALFWVGNIFSRNCDDGIDDWIRAGMFTFCFTCVVDLIIWLDFIGAIKGFMTIYLQTCETYLNCSWGAAIGVFDAVGFYSMYHLMMYRQSVGREWMSVGVYWAGGLLNSMFVEIFGALASKQKITVAILLNVPYFVLPSALLFRAFTKETIVSKGRCFEIRSASQNTLPFKLIDGCLFLGLLLSSYIILAKGTCGLGSEVSWLKFIADSEPFLLLEDPAPYGRVQVVLLLLWVLPLHFLSMWALCRGSTSFPWFKQLVIFQAGIMLHAQYNYIYPSLDPLSPQNFTSSWNDPIFWVSNISIFLFPHLLLARILRISCRSLDSTWNSLESGEPCPTPVVSTVG